MNRLHFEVSGLATVSRVLFFSVGPTAILLIVGIVSVVRGDSGTLADSNGQIIAWGYNDNGQAEVPYGAFTAIAHASGSHNLAIRSDGTIVAWGRNNYGQASSPSGTFTDVAADGYHSLAVRSNGTLLAWGSGNYGMNTLPTGTYTAIAAGYEHNLAIASDGSLHAWGKTTTANAAFLMGRSYLSPRETPTVSPCVRVPSIATILRCLARASRRISTARSQSAAMPPSSRRCISTTTRQ